MKNARGTFLATRFNHQEPPARTARQVNRIERVSGHILNVSFMSACDFRHLVGDGNKRILSMYLQYLERIRFLVGPTVTALVVGVIEAARILEFTIPNPQLFTAAAITFAAYVGGYRGGLPAVVIGTGYAFYFFSTPGHLFNYTYINSLKILVNCITLPLIAVLVSELNKKYSRSIKNEMESFIQNANAPVLSLTPAGHVVLWNNYLENLTGYSKEDILGRPLQSHQVFDGDAGWLGRFLNAKVGSANREILEIPLRTRSGEPVELLASATRQRDRDGIVSGIVCIGQEITQRKKAEKLLGESKQRYQSLVDLSPDGIMVHRNDEIVFCNEAMAAMLGATSQAQIVGRPELDFIPSEDRGAVFARRKAAEAGQKVGLRETRYRRMDGSLINVERTVAVIQWENQKAFMVLTRDITERRNAEKQLRQIVDSLQDGFALYDTDERLLIWNEKWLEISQLKAEALKVGTPFEEVLRTKVGHGLYPEAIGREEEFIAERMRYHQCPEGLIIRQLKDDRWIIIREARTPDGGTFTITTDITDIKNAENAAQEARKAAEEADRSKSEFLANMSHELRTPLNAIIGFSASMEGECFGPIGNPKYRNYIRDINQSGQHLLALISDILDLSKIESGAEDLREEDIDVLDLAQSAIRVLEDRARKDDVDLVLKAAGDLPALRADSRKVNQILFNLLTNAIKFTEPGGKVTLEICAGADRGFVFEVADTGIGIAPENIEKALSKFGQVSSALTRRHEGTGLGLPLTVGLVELHGGDCVVESELGVGTKVTVRFPADRIVQPRAAVVAPSM